MLRAPSARRRSCSLFTLLLTAGLWSAGAVAAEPSVIAKTHPRGDQPQLSVGFDANGLLRAEVGATPSRGLERGVTLNVPDSILALRAQSKLQIVPLSEQRQAIVVTLPTDVPTRQWQALIVAKPGKSEPEIVFQGFTGYIEGEEGLRKGPVLEVSEPIDHAGSRRIVTGEIQEELTLCGRRALLAPKMLSPRTLALEPAKLQRLPATERERAVALTAEPRAAEPAATTTLDVTTTTPTTGASAAAPSAQRPTLVAPVVGRSASLLRAVGASSAIGWPASLTDGDPETTWSENRGGAGRGEFVTFRTPSDVPLQGFDFVVKPAKRDLPKGVGPEKLWLVTQQQLYSVSFPTDPWKAPLVRWHVSLPAPVKTDCVAVVSESAYGEAPDSLLTLAEIAAQSEFEDASIEELVGALAGGGPRAEAASTVLSAMGEPAFVAVAKAFDGLDEGGRRVALDVFDHSTCELSSPVYIQALLGKNEAHRLHASDRLHRCGSRAIAAIEQTLGNRPSQKHRPLLELLGDIAPERAVSYLVPRLEGSAKLRRELREVLAVAARSPKAQDALRAELGRAELSRAALVDTLRALGARVVNYSALVTPRLETLLATETDWQVRFLMLAPAQFLAKQSPRLTELLSRSIRTDPSSYVRAEAIRTLHDTTLFSADVVAATRDPDVRVRHAATTALSGERAPKSVEAVATRLKDDQWPLVRAEAAQSLASQPSNPDVDRWLSKALDDPAWTVRAAAIEALGKRRVKGAAESLLEHFEDRDERFEVRVTAARSLGELCYEGAVGSLTEHARKLAAAGMELRDRAVAASALNALGAIHPSDLAKRLDPLINGKDVQPEIRAAAKAAVASPRRCNSAKAEPPKTEPAKPGSKASLEGRWSLYQ